MDKTGEALEHARLAYEGLNRLFGADNLMARRALHLYASCLRDGGEPEEAAHILEGLLASHGEGVRDADFAYLSLALAATLHDLERFDEAEALYLDALEVYGALGNAHRDQILTVRHNLAYLFRQTGRLEEALELALAVLSERERFLGLAHPDSRASLNNLAEIYRALERPVDEETTRRRKLTALTDAKGPDTWETRQAREELAELLTRMGRPDEAAALERP
jgi:tetratricopeptide (TPR) repeat protein